MIALLRRLLPGKAKSKRRAKPYKLAETDDPTGRERDPNAPAAVRAKLRAVALAAMVVATVWGLVIALGELERSVLTRQSSAVRTVTLRVTDRPAWMPASLERRILSQLTPPVAPGSDADLPRAVYDRALRCAWIRRVESVRRRSGGDPTVAVIELRAEFRKPVAKVPVGTGHACLDADAISLPANQVPQWVSRVKRADGTTKQVCYITPEEVPPGQVARPVHYVLIDGVAAYPPPFGKQWPGQDVAAGLRLIELIRQKHWANQVTVVDVRNHAGRISEEEPHLRLYAQVGQGRATDIRFGRFPRPGGDYVISPDRKMSYLDQYVARNQGRLAGANAYLDLRYHQLHVSVY